MAAKVAAQAVPQDDLSTEERLELGTTYKALNNQLQQYAAKLQELNQSRAEHQLVVDAIKNVDPDRRCFRLIGGVLVERTVKETLPSVEKNIEGLTAIMGKLQEQIDQTQKDILPVRIKLGFIKPEQQLQAAAAAAGIGGSSGGSSSSSSSSSGGDSGKSGKGSEAI